ncbi:uncharacterized protein EV422DRAFT_63453 [Fimicolochytrium jonesii]|uniref:uncharacterized protein n=1 Tax=Fimicolochytrium jonesii TaxID=1396493 RepID=UPI0022FF2BFF|nr:uncharacterized protein EV422DRAFT_63453 [Fimicolochytrium jonesii]KAI8820789.1 hypothetical protein EV422DRAFT_63453 [Fimicolochytrium jonesii]
MSTLQPTSTPPASPWQPIYDESTQLYYWWNTVTNETSWDDPKEVLENVKGESGGEAVDSEEGESREENNAAKEDTVTVPEGSEGEALVEGTDSPPSRTPKGEPKPEPTAPSIDSTNPLPADATRTEASQTAHADYYNSEEYYNWYYSTYQPQAAGTVAGVAGAPSDAQPSYGGYGISTAYGTKPGVIGVDSDYTVTGAFNPRTGRFQNPDRDERFAAPDQYFNQNTKAARQMSFYFDYDKYQEERAAKRMAEMSEEGGEGGGKRQKKLTKKELEMFKQKKKEKKLGALRARFGAD